MDIISRHSLGVEQVWFGNLAIASLLFADDVVLLVSSDHELWHSLQRFAADCKAAGMRVKSEAMVLCRKPVDCSLQVGTECLLQAKEFKYIGVLFTSEGKMVDRCGCSSKTGAAPDRLGGAGEGAEPKGKALNLLVGLRYNPHICSQTLGRDRKNKVVNTSIRN